jgi:hypothetical protein
MARLELRLSDDEKKRWQTRADFLELSLTEFVKASVEGRLAHSEVKLVGGPNEVTRDLAKKDVTPRFKREK